MWGKPLVPGHSDGPVFESDETSSDFIVDCDRDGHIVPIKILDAANRVDEMTNFKSEVVSSSVIYNRTEHRAFSR